MLPRSASIRYSANQTGFLGLEPVLRLNRENRNKRKREGLGEFGLITSRQGRMKWLSVLLVVLGSLDPAAREPNPVGKLVDLGGHKLHVNCTGSGRPTVVVENGQGDFSFDWRWCKEAFFGFPASAPMIGRVTLGAIQVPDREHLHS